MVTLLSDIRYAIRTLSRSPGYCAVAVLTLAIGIAANTTMFSVVNAMLLRPLPFPNHERIVQVHAANPGKGWRHVPVSPLDFLDWRKQNDSFERIVAGRFWFHTLSGAGDPEQLHGMRVSPGFFSNLGVQPALGRGFQPEEEQPGRDQVAILTHRLWERRFGADPTLIGKTISIDAQPFTVVGVLPRDFWFYPVLDEDIDLWMPLAFAPSDLNRDARSIFVHGLLKPGVSIEQARAEMTALSRRLARQYPKENQGWEAEVEPGLLSKEHIRPRILLLFAAVGLVLLIACANVANLALARAVRRRPEVALRAALGASRGALVRQLLVESTLLATIACVSGLALAFLSHHLVVAFLTPRLEGFFYGGVENLTLDPVVVAFSLGVSLFSGVLFGLVPAAQAASPNVAGVLQAGGRGSTHGTAGTRVQDLLMVSQVALAVALSVGAGLMIRSLAALEHVDRGLNAQNLLTAQIWPPQSRYSEPPEIARFHQRVLENVRTLPDVSSASAISFLPLSEIGVGWNFEIEGRPAPSPEERPNALYYAVGADYLETMQIPLLRGRSFEESDSPASLPVAVIDEKLANRYWPDQDPIGQRFRFDPLDTESPWHAHLTRGWTTVVGVAATVRGDGLWEDGAPVIYLPFQQNPSRMMHLVVRTARDPILLAQALQSKVWELDANQPVSFIRSMEEVPAWALADKRLTMQLLGAFAFLAVLLAASGIYAVISYAVTRRTQEIGIRIALGARRSQVAAMVVTHGLKLALTGLATGVVLALALTHLLSSQLFGVAPTDPATFASSCLFLFAVSLLAAYLPARRAGRVDPMTALRDE